MILELQDNVPLELIKLIVLSLIRLQLAVMIPLQRINVLGKSMVQEGLIQQYNQLQQLGLQERIILEIPIHVKQRQLFVALQ
jgi:hypothetical protein